MRSALAFLVAGCSHAAGPVRIVEGSRPDTLVTGVQLVALEGGPLSAPTPVPLWLETPPAGEEPGRWDVRVNWIELTNGDLYVDERSPELGLACRLLHDGVFRASPCLETTFETIYLDAVRPGLVVAREYAEGCGVFEIFRWDASGQQRLLSKGLGCVEGAVEWRADGAELVLRSNCDLSGEGCPAMSNEPEMRTWRWSEAGGLRGPIP